jgi:hypothetical protein
MFVMKGAEIPLWCPFATRNGPFGLFLGLIAQESTTRLLHGPTAVRLELVCDGKQNTAGLEITLAMSGGPRSSEGERRLRCC